MFIKIIFKISFTPKVFTNERHGLQKKTLIMVNTHRENLSKGPSRTQLGNATQKKCGTQVKNRNKNKLSVFTITFRVGSTW